MTEETLYALELTTRLNIRGLPVRIKAAIQAKATKRLERETKWNMEKEIVETLTRVYGPLADAMESEGEILPQKPKETA